MPRKSEFEVQDLSERVAALLRERKRVESAYRRGLAHVARGASVLSQRIKNGRATSGDRIFDFCLIAYKELDPYFSQPLQELEKQLMGKRGELFLVVCRERKQHAFFASDDDGFHLETRCALGILSSETLVLRSDACSYGLPSERYEELSAGQVTEVSGPFLFTEPTPLTLNKMIQAGYESGLALEMFIGDTAVFGYVPTNLPWTQHPPWPIRLNRMARRLGRDIPISSEETTIEEKEKGKVLSFLEESIRELRFRLQMLGGARNHGIEKKVRIAVSDILFWLSQAKELGLGEDPKVKSIAAEVAAASR